MAEQKKYTLANPPPQVVQIVEDKPITPELAHGVADAVKHPLLAQFTYDTLSMLIEACRREREKNYEAIARFPAKGPPFIEKSTDVMEPLAGEHSFDEVEPHTEEEGEPGESSSGRGDASP
mmetsp:Transcript_21687/g.49365  ORF Transcript_21687/g.49365 Transcript_21687/m.49365 type:complete len:121 (-) Transcript_21687:62-424(-)